MKSIDIETIPNMALVDSLPEPEVAVGHLKDEAKIAEKIAQAKKKQIDSMALDPFYARICSYAVASDTDLGVYHVVGDTSEAEEIVLVTELLKELVVPDMYQTTFCTFNGYFFDLPFIFKRAMLLNITLPDNCPTLKTFARRYDHIPHCDVMQELVGWQTGKYISLENSSRAILGKGKIDCDVTKFIEMIRNGKQDEIGTYNLEDSELTLSLYKKIKSYLF